MQYIVFGQRTLELRKQAIAFAECCRRKLGENGEEKYRDLLQKYADTYEGLYDMANQDDRDLMEDELLADAYAGMNRFKNADVALYQEDVRQAVSDRNSTQNAEATDERTGPTSQKYSVQELENGTIYIKLDGKGFYNEDGSRMTRAEAYNSIVGKTITTKDGEKIKIIKRLPKKNLLYENFRRKPNYDGDIDIENLNEEINNNYIDILENSTPLDMGQEDIGGTHEKNGIDGFDTRKTIIADKDGAYDLELTIAILKNGEKVAYAKKHVTPNKDVTEKIQANERISSSHLNQMPVGGRITQDKTNVKQRFSASDDDGVAYMEAVKPYYSIRFESRCFSVYLLA